MILGGVVYGGGGAVILPNGKRVPIDPPLPFDRIRIETLTRKQRDMLFGAVLNELAALASDAQFKRGAREAAAALLEESLKHREPSRSPVLVGSENGDGDGNGSLDPDRPD